MTLLPYRVSVWRGELVELARFRDFDAALRWAQNYALDEGEPSLQLTNPDRIDGAEDAPAHAQLGLTVEEYEELEAAGLV